MNKHTEMVGIMSEHKELLGVLYFDRKVGKKTVLMNIEAIIRDIDIKQETLWKIIRTEKWPVYRGISGRLYLHGDQLNILLDRFDRGEL